MRRIIILTLFAVVSTIARAEYIDSDFNAIKFAYEMFLLDNYDKIIEISKENGFVEKDSKYKTQYFALRNKGRKPMLIISKWKKKDIKLKEINICVNKWSDDEIVDCLIELGFKETGTKNRSLADTPVVDRIFENDNGTQRIVFETYHGTNIVKTVNFYWLISDKKAKEDASAQYATAKQKKQNDQKDGVNLVYPNEVGQVNSENKTKSPANTSDGKEMNTSKEESTSLEGVGAPWKKPDRKDFLDIEYQKIPNYNTLFSALNNPNSYGAKFTCIDDELKRNGVKVYYSEHPLGTMPFIIDAYTIPLWTSYRYGDNYWKGKSKTSERWVKDNEKMTERFGKRLEHEFKKHACVNIINSCAAPHTGVKMVRNFEMTGIDNYYNKWGLDASMADIIFSGKVDKIPDDFNSFTYGIILINDCRIMYCVNQVGSIYGYGQDSEIKIDKYDSKNYNVKFRVRLDHKTAYVLSCLTNIMLVRQDSEIWKMANKNHGILVEAYDKALKKAKDEKYKEFNRGYKTH